MEARPPRHANEGDGWRGNGWLWARFPAAYLPYALLRGTMEGANAYPFINLAKPGPGQVMMNSLAIRAGFLPAGHALLWIDRRLSAPPLPPAPTR